MNARRIALGLATLLLLGLEWGTDASSMASQAPKKENARHTDFVFFRPDGEKAVPLKLEGTGNLPLWVLVEESGSWRQDRKLQVFVTVYEPRTRGGWVPGQLLKTWKSPEILETPAGQNGGMEVKHLIPLPPGAYPFEVFLCDPQIPPGTKDAPPPWWTPYRPAPEDFPGKVLKMQLGQLTVH